MRIKWSIFLFLTGLILLGHIFLLGQNYDRVKIQTIQLTDNIHALVSRAGGNVLALNGSEGVVLVDCDMPQISKKIADAVKAISDKPVAYVINTHWHFDHVGGNEYFAKAGAKIIAHANVVSKMKRDQKIGLLNIDVKAAPKLALPTITYDGKKKILINGETIEILHIPNAHTNGDSCVIFKEANIIHTGDLVFNRMFPFIDISSGGNIRGIIKGLKSILAMSDDKTVIIPGHGPFMKMSDLKKYVQMLSLFSDRVGTLVESGKPLEVIERDAEIVKLFETYKYRHFPPKMFIKMVYLSHKK